MTYKQLNYEQRYSIELMLKTKVTKKDIVDSLCINESSLYRELKRNRQTRGGYNAQFAHMLANERKKEGHYKHKFTQKMMDVIKDKLCNDQWSPEQITGWCKQGGIDMVSHERIYQYVWQDKKQKGQLYTHLRNSDKKYKKRYGAKDNRGSIPDRVSIEQRPDVVDRKTRPGDWEMDLIIGKGHKGSVLTIVERSTGFTLLAKTDGKKASSIKKQAINTLAPYKSIVHTITNDNGKEFSMHKDIAAKLQTDIYFAHPYASWERGLNEYTNKLIRQYLPKKIDLRPVKTSALAIIANKLNNRPRKKLNYKTPMELFMNNFKP